MELEQVGASHPRVRQARALQAHNDPDRARLLVADGVWAHDVLLTTPARIETFLWCPEAAYSDHARALAKQAAPRATTAYRISAKTLGRLTDRDKPDGLVSVVELPTWAPEAVTLADDALVAVADGLETPGNVGTLIRTLDACAGAALLVTNRRTQLTHPKVFRGSHGMNLTVPHLEFAEVEEAVSWLRQYGFTTYLADPSSAQHYRLADYSGRTAIVLGSERFGISRSWYDHGFDRVAVPLLGRADSLNVSVSASVLLYEARARKADW